MTKRNNNSKQVELINIDDNAQAKIESIVNGAQLVPFNDIASAGNYADSHKIALLPNYTSEGNLSYYAIGLIPNFDAFITTASGLDYARNQFNLRVYKRIRDNMRQAMLDGTQYNLPIQYESFVTASRESSGFSDEFKKSVTSLCKALAEKLASKAPTAKALLTQKNMLLALSNEKAAQALFPFLIGSDGKTILGKWLEKQLSTIHKATCEALLNIRESQDYDDNIGSVDDLLD